MVTSTAARPMQTIAYTSVAGVDGLLAGGVPPHRRLLCTGLPRARDRRHNHNHRKSPHPVGIHTLS
eukprot:6721498-Alexandrium_andersonii.AAC.1